MGHNLTVHFYNGSKWPLTIQNCPLLNVLRGERTITNAIHKMDNKFFFLLYFTEQVDKIWSSTVCVYYSYYVECS